MKSEEMKKMLFIISLISLLPLSGFAEPLWYVLANPEKFDIISSFKVPLGKGPHWGHPSISDGRLYIRHGEALMVYDIQAQ